MIICKDNDGICSKSKEDICCIDCKKFIECKEEGCICPSLRYSNTRELIIKKCIFAKNKD